MTRTHDTSYKTSLMRLLFLPRLTPVGACLRAVLAGALLNMPPSGDGPSAPQ